MIFLQLIIHRGFHDKKDEENKLPAFQKVFTNEKYAGIETDIRVTLDKVFVLYHSPLYKGKLINNCLYNELKKDNIPALEDLLKIPTSKILLLEIKDFNLNLSKLLKLLNKYPRNIYLMSFSNKVIQKLKDLKCQYPIGVLNYVFNSTESYDYDFICLISDILTPSMIDSFKRLNVQTFVYGIREKDTIKYPELTYIVDNKYLE